MFLSQSEIAAFTRCPRMWLIEYYLGYVRADEPPFGNRWLGIRVHTALEGHYGYGLDALVTLHFLYEIAIKAQPEFEIDLKNERALALIMVQGYLEWAEKEGKDTDLKVIWTEFDLQVRLPELQDVVLRSRIDQVVHQMSTNTLWFLDHKTAADFEKHETLERNPQFRFYSLMQFLAAGHGVPMPGMELRPDRPVVMGGIINTLRRVKRTSASRPPYYMRDSVSYNLDVLSATHDKVRKIAYEIMTVRAQMDEARERGASITEFNTLQRFYARPVPIERDCDWRCGAASGLCVAMDDGSDWGSILDRSGHFVRQDPYSRYADDPLQAVREKIASS